MIYEDDRTFRTGQKIDFLEDLQGNQWEPEDAEIVMEGGHMGAIAYVRWRAPNGGDAFCLATLRS